MSTRYKKQELFLGTERQKLLEMSDVVIIGAGALGSASAEMLARAGIGSLSIVDRDYVEWSNLQRQQLYTEKDAENKLPKAIAAKKRLDQINSEIKIEAIIADVNGSNIEEIVAEKSLILDATDNFETRMIINDAAIKLGIPFVFGACVASYGLIFPILPGKTPCLHCLVNYLPTQGMTCDIVGVISPIVQLVASYQVMNVLKIVTGDEPYPFLQSFDIWKNDQSEINVQKLKHKKCPTCSEEATFPYLSLENQTKTDVLCGRNAVQLRPAAEKDIPLAILAQKLEGSVADLIVNPYLLSCSIENHRLVLFKDGRAIIHGTNEPPRARSIYTKIVE